MKYSDFYKIKLGEVLNNWYSGVREKNEFIILFSFFDGKE